MASNPPGACCYAGVKHEGSSVGEINSLGDVRTYYSYPKDGSTENAILILTDVIGIDFINPQLIADQLAANGYFVMMPDLFHGDPVPLNKPGGFSLPEWLKGHGTERVDPIVEAALNELRGPLGAKRVGAIGYCFGGKYVARYLKEGKIDVGFMAHPSFVTEEEIRGAYGPLSIVAAETDEIFTVELRRKSEEILREKKTPWQINLYSGVQHGFAVRGDPKNKVQKFAKEQAFLQAVQWFEEYLKQ